ncbi:hypothetical protein PAHAL_2G058100 [Panicum hallii]|jgi:hypothetical protein|uniref:Uncharacterized protein n=1 Tax=Panicum hallii TaxID=206008 RepID=A0A2T8KN50_9POAL|nr:hypothetical protein PAHAL_2G058100 [Panicum hallii]
MPTRETTPPPAASKPTKGKKAKEKTKAVGNRKKKIVSVPHDSPTMGTRSKIPQKQSPSLRTGSTSTSRLELLLDVVLFSFRGNSYFACSFMTQIYY